MDKVFFAKTNGPQMISQRIFEGPVKYFGTIDVGDYAFIHPEKRQVTELWKAERWEPLADPDQKRLVFSLVVTFTPEIRTWEQFLELKLFKLDLNLLNKIVSQGKGICFFELQLSSAQALATIKNATSLLAYLGDADNYRKVIVCPSLQDVDPSSDDIQLYKENGEFKLYASPFIDAEVINNFQSDNYAYGKQAGNIKGKYYRILDSGTTVIPGSMASIKGLYDLFCTRITPSDNSRADFVTWLKNHGVKKAFNSYVRGLRNVEKEYNVDIDEEYDKDGCVALLDTITNDPAVIDAKQNQNNDKKNWDYYLNKYIEYKDELAGISSGAGSSVAASVATAVGGSAFDPLKKVYLDDVDRDKLERLILLKKNVILQGAPGVGKTYSAKKIAYHIMGKEDDSRIKVVQFHQNYSYEDFVRGYKPKDVTFVLQDGIFYEFCNEARKQEADNVPYFLIIDEINRGNLSKIFGELLMLIENDHRGEELTLAYRKYDSNGQPIQELFSVPKNLYIIGMMNTADRSLALIDYALRRRFSFFMMQPAFRKKKGEARVLNSKFEAYLNEFSTSNRDAILEVLDLVGELNDEIKNDPALGEGFCIGHSYFCINDDQVRQDVEKDIKGWLKQIVEFDILPTLREYWFDVVNLEDDDRVKPFIDYLNA